MVRDFIQTVYPQSQNSWTISLPPPNLFSCVISTLRRKPCEQEKHNILASRGSTSSGASSAPHSRTILLSKIHPSLASRSYKSTRTGTDTPSTQTAKWTDLGRSPFLRHILKIIKIKSNIVN